MIQIKQKLDWILSAYILKTLQTHYSMITRIILY